jgi:hypothetical protein
MMDAASLLLELIKLLRWPIVVLILVFTFRAEVRAALRRVAQVRAGPIEIQLRELAERYPEFFQEEED